MKAFVCPQCGGLFDRVSETGAIAECGYCGARVLIRESEKPPPPPGPEPRDTLHIPLEDYKPFDEYEPVPDQVEFEDFYDKAPDRTVKTAGVLALAGVAVFFLLIVGFLASNKKPKQSLASTPAPYRTATPPSRLFSEPLTAADAISLPAPVIPKNVRIPRKTLVEVYLSVDEQGNVYDASANTEDESLRKIAVEAGMKAKFKPSATNQRASGLIIYSIGPN